LCGKLEALRIYDYDFGPAIQTRGVTSLHQNKKRPSATPQKSSAGVDVRASLQMVGWVNSTLDVAAGCLGKKGTREAALALLILHQNRNGISGKKLIQMYRAWSATARAPIEDSLRIAHGRLIREGLLEVGAIGRTDVSKLKHASLQKAVGRLLEKGLLPVKQIRLTDLGLERTKMMRRKIDDRLNSIRAELNPRDQVIFNKLIEDILPYPSKSGEDMPQGSTAPKPVRKIEPKITIPKARLRA
jgi:hypothetical protein